MRSRSQKVRLALPIVVAISCGVFLSVASHSLSWSSASVFVVGMALAALLGLLGTPLLLLTWSEKPVGGRWRPAGSAASAPEPWDMRHFEFVYEPSLETMRTSARGSANELRLRSASPASFNLSDSEADLLRIQAALRASSHYVSRDSTRADADSPPLNTAIETRRRGERAEINTSARPLVPEVVAASR